MVKKLIVFFILLCPILLMAQITVSVQLPPAGLIQRDQLWNIIVVNAGNEIKDITISLRLQDAVSGQAVLSGISRSITLPKGVKVFNGQDVQPVHYTTGAGISTGNYLPLGSFIACYSFSRVVGEKADAFADECVRININPLSPPLLVIPADKSVISTPYPQLAWMAPAPADIFGNLYYDIAIAELLQGQSAAEAILYNTPAYIKSHVTALYENYPSSYAKLQPGKTYAWQITARNGQSYAAVTDVWTFTVSKDSTSILPDNATYILLEDNKIENGVNYVTDNSINIKYYSFLAEHDAVIEFKNKEGKILQQKKLKVKYGDNFYKFPVTNRFQKEDIYYIEIKDPQNKLHTASFSIK